MAPANPAFRSSLRAVVTGVFLAALAVPAPAGFIDTMLENFQRSEFAFGRTDSVGPFPPMAWVGISNHGESEVALPDGPVRFGEHGGSQFLIAPLWIGKKDMILAGEYFSWQRIEFLQPQPADRDLYTFAPVFAWLRQTGPHTQVGAFAAPQWSHGADYADNEFAEWTGYAGALAIKWSSEELGWGYGIVADFGPDDTLIFPYLGCLWLPTPEWNIAAILPWPSISYAPSRNYFFQVGLSPADATLAVGQGGAGLRLSYTSWDLRFTFHRRITRNFWFSASVGQAGIGSFAVSTSGNEADYSLQRDVVWSLEFSFRPPTKGIPDPR